jgi:hypothetical protein
MKPSISFALLALVFAACDNNFVMPYEVAGPRLMGVRVEPENDPDRAWPRVGEDFTLRWRVARKGKPSNLPLDEQLTGGIALCAGAILPTGTLFCVQEIDLDGQMLKPPNVVSSSDDLEMPIKLAFDPRMFGLGERILLFGAVCVDGEIERVKGKKVGDDPANELYRCKNNGDAELKTPLAFTSSILVDYEDDDLVANRHPSFACDPEDEGGLCEKGRKQSGEARLGGPFVIVFPNERDDDADKKVVAWPASPLAPEELPWNNCKDAEDVLQVHAGSKEHVIRVRFDPSDRETYDAVETFNGKPVMRKKREELQIAHAASEGGGQIARYYSVIDRNSDDDDAELDLEYLPPEADSVEAKEIPSGGLLVRFHFAVRDMRGGVDFATRELCLLRPKVVN